MVYAYQKDSYLKIFTSKVKSCNAATNEKLIDGKKIKPSDRGTINGIPIIDVSRKGSEAVHFVDKEMKVGDEVKVEVDWERRWDHMQQHSGQHLISALATELFGYDTTAWNLGEKISFVELNTSEMSTEQVERLEKISNEKIRDSVSMHCRIIEDKNSPEVDEIRCRGLPDDHVGPIRVITIEGVDVNLCCGTHVSNLSHLQVIKLFGVEKGKKGKVNLTFLVGERVLKFVSTVHEREKMFTKMLKGGPDDHVSLLQKIQDSLKIAQKNSQTLLREVAEFEVEKLKNEKPAKHFLHKKEGDMGFMNFIANEVDQDVFLLLTTGDEKGQGMFLLSGKPEIVQHFGPKVAQILEGKGAGKGSRYQGKAECMANLKVVDDVINRTFNNFADQ